jgi:hypothetical protein
VDVYQPEGGRRFSDDYCVSGRERNAADLKKGLA